MKLVGGYWGWNWAAACRDLSAAYRTYPHPTLAVSSSPFTNEWGLTMLVVAAVPVAEYRGEIDVVWDAALDSARNRSEQTTALIDRVRAETGSALAGNRAVQVVQWFRCHGLSSSYRLASHRAHGRSKRCFGVV